MDSLVEPKAVQHVPKSSSDKLLRKFAEVDTGPEEKAAAKRDLQLAKRRRKKINPVPVSQIESDDQCENTLKSLIPAGGSQRRSGIVRRLGIGKARLRNRSILGTIEKTWRKTIEGASRVLLEKHHNRHKRLISDVA